MFYRKYFCFLFVILFSFNFSNLAFSAYPIESIGLDPIKKDFVVGPGKQEFFLKPGETARAEIIVSNRMGEDRMFELNVEDFKGSRDINKSVELLGDVDGPYSLKKYINFEEKRFLLPNGTRARIPVTIKIPENAEPGGFYGSLVVSTVKPIDKQDASGGAKGGVPLELRSAVLFFIRVDGFVHEEGKLVDFRILNDRNLFSGGEEVRLQLIFENNGSVHLDPYGEISVSNIMGQEIISKEIDPWYSMPDSLRSREDNIKTDGMMGRYAVSANIYRGYGDMEDIKSYDKMTLTFWVIPWNYILIIFVVVLLLNFVISWLKKNFEFKRK